jgi:17beta-estradiol 17-dehydrogenase / very-long-chain 3-oxoacyl-CoA reductase
MNLDVTPYIDGHILTGLAAVGALYTAKTAIVPFKNVYKQYLRPRRNLTKRYGGDWAVVTGGSDGIGEQISYQLAKSGFNIVLISNSPERLEEVAKTINT